MTLRRTVALQIAFQGGAVNLDPLHRHRRLGPGAKTEQQRKNSGCTASRYHGDLPVLWPQPSKPDSYRLPILNALI